eukprot:22504-Chlamydomonas_euryale.AAC.1
MAVVGVVVHAMAWRRWHGIAVQSSTPMPCFLHGSAWALNPYTKNPTMALILAKWHPPWHHAANSCMAEATGTSVMLTRSRHTCSGGAV